MPAFASLFGVLCLLVADRGPARSKSSRAGRGIAAAAIFFVLGLLDSIALFSPNPWLLDRPMLLIALQFTRIWGNFLLGIGLSLAIVMIVISDWRKRWPAVP